MPSPPFFFSYLPGMGFLGNKSDLEDLEEENPAFIEADRFAVGLSSSSSRLP